MMKPVLYRGFPLDRQIEFDLRHNLLHTTAILCCFMYEICHTEYKIYKTLKSI